MKLNPIRFNAHLANMGQDFTWAQGFACACVNPNSGAARQGCGVCFGRGRFWAPKVPATAGVANQKTQMQWAQLGMWEEGDTVLSIPNNSPLYGAGQYDRIMALNTTEAFSIVVPPGSTRLQVPVISINRVFWMNADLTMTIDGAIPVFDANGNLSWPNGSAPPADQSYSVTGVQYQEFYVFQFFPSNRNEHHGFLLPKRLVARRFSLFGK